MIKFFYILFLFLSFQSVAVTTFKTDGCTGYFDGSWRDCCIEHDFYYWIGGTQIQKQLADDKLYQCVKDHSTFNAWLMKIGVSIGHLSPYKIKDKKWANGLGVDEMDRSLTKSEVEKFQVSLQDKGSLDKSTEDQFVHHLQTLILQP